MLDTVVISGDEVCCSVVFGTLVSVFVFSVMWSELLMSCQVPRRYINVCNCDMFSVVNVYIDHLKFCVVCIDGRRYVCCSECNVSNQCKDPTSCLVQPIGTHGGEVMYVLVLGVSLVSWIVMISACVA